MKKILAFAVIFATVCSLSACKMSGKKLTAEERESSIAEQSLKVEREYIEGVNETVEDEIGKTIKGERLVVKTDNDLGYEYFVFVFDKKENIKEKYTYKFYDQMINYEMMLDIKENGDNKQVDHDKTRRMVVYKKTKNLNDETFTTLYNFYTDPARVKRGYQVIE